MIASVLLTLTILYPVPTEAGDGPTLKWFEPGWHAYSEQTYTGPCEPGYVLPHRLARGATFLYLEDGCRTTTVAEWHEYIARIPDGVVVAPLAEMNGDWVPWHTSPAVFRAEYAAIRAADPTNRLTWCWAPNRGLDWQAWEPADYDLLCPSVYDFQGEGGAAIAELTADMAREVGKPAVLAQTGTVGEYCAWLEALMSRARFDNVIKAVYYFNKDDARTWAHDKEACT